MPVTILVTSDQWSNNGKIPEICVAAREHFKTIALELVETENSTPETVMAGLKKALKEWSTKQTVESMIIKDLLISSYSDEADTEALWGTKEQAKTLYTKKGILYVSESLYGGRYSYRSYGRYDYEDDYAGFESTYPALVTPTVKTRHAKYDDMTEEEIFELFYQQNPVTATLM